MTKLFEPYRVADLTLKNRFIVAPMCQYSARHGVPKNLQDLAVHQCLPIK